MKKRILSMILTLVMIISLAAGGAAMAEEKIHIGFSVMSLANVYWSTFQQSMEAECEALGYEITVHDGKNDVSLQVNAIENWIVQGVDAIIVGAVDPVALQPACEMAIQAGIPVVNVTAGKIENINSNIDVNQYNYGYTAGKLAADWINANLADEEEVQACIFDKPSSLVVAERAKGIAAGLTENAANVVIVANQPATTSDMGVTAAETIIQAYPGIDCFVGVTDAGVLGAYEALVASGMDTSKMCLVGVDATDEALRLISEGTCYRASVSLSADQLAKDAIKTAIDAANGIEVFDAAVKTEAVTIENVAEYMK